MHEKRTIIGYIRAAVSTKKIDVAETNVWKGQRRTEKSNEYKDHRKIDRVWYESKGIAQDRGVPESILSGRGAEQRSMERNYQSPARFRHVAVVVLPLFCLVLYRANPRTVFWTSPLFPRLCQPHLLPTILSISFHLSYVREATHDRSVETTRLEVYLHAHSAFRWVTLWLNNWTTFLLRWISNPSQT